MPFDAKKERSFMIKDKIYMLQFGEFVDYDNGLLGEKAYQTTIIYKKDDGHMFIKGLIYFEKHQFKNVTMIMKDIKKLEKLI